MLRVLIVAAALVSQAAAAQTVLRVTSADDDGTPGTLRHAIETSNAAPGSHRIEIAGGLTIRPQNLLPPIVGPVVVHGEAGAVIDGAAIIDAADMRSCPGENPAQFGPNVRTVQKPGLAVVDTSGVEIAGVEVRNFCIGILSWRSAGSYFHHNRLVNNIGGAGIMFTGDDGAGNPTAGKSVDGRVEFNAFIDNGDGLELTRGTETTRVANNTFTIGPAGLTPSQGIEVLASNNDTIVDNTFSGFSDGLQVGGEGHTLKGNVISDTAYGITVSGRNVTIAANRISGVRVGIGVRGTGHVLAGNLIADTGRDISRCNAGGICADNPQYAAIRGGIDLGLDGPTANDPGAQCPDGLPDCDSGANGLQNYPDLSPSSAWADGHIVAVATLVSRPFIDYRLEFFASRVADSGEVLLGEASTTTDMNGRATVIVIFNGDDPLKDGKGQLVLTATATGPEGTSEFSPGLTLIRK